MFLFFRISEYTMSHCPALPGEHGMHDADKVLYCYKSVWPSPWPAIRLHMRAAPGPVRGGIP